MHATLSAGQGLGLVLVGILVGAALLMLFIGWLGTLGQDNSGVGCINIGWGLLAIAIYIAVRVLIS